MATASGVCIPHCKAWPTRDGGLIQHNCCLMKISDEKLRIENESTLLDICLRMMFFHWHSRY